MNNDEIGLALIQPDIVWENPEKNRSIFDRIFNLLPSDTDLVVLPEMFTTGFSMNVKGYAEQMNGETIEWLKLRATQLNATISGSLMIKDEKNVFNRFVFVTPDGNVLHYDKYHLFTFANEHLHFSPGTERKIIKVKSFCILPQICYDIRFPVFNRSQNDYDLMIVCASWPASRQKVWNTLLRARAIENQTYVVGVNRIGVDGNGINYSGGTVVFDSEGEEIQFCNSHEKCFFTARLKKTHLQDFRSRFPAWKDADSFILKSRNI